MDLSPYHHTDFSGWEQRAVEAITGLGYSQIISVDEQNILLTNTHTRFDELSDDLLAKVSLVIHANSGYDNIPLRIARLPNFEIVVGNPVRSQAVATYVLSQLLNHYNPSPHSLAWQG